MPAPEFIPFTDRYVPPTAAEAAANAFYEVMRRRRSVRMFRSDPVPRAVIESLVRTAGSAPSGANKQPWRFVCVSDPELKRVIREGAEAEEREFYSRRASERWLRDLEPLGTDSDKAFLEHAPWLVVVFKRMKGDSDAAGGDALSGPDPEGTSPVASSPGGSTSGRSAGAGQVYYVNESVGLACGMFLAAAQHAGLATLTHTPSPMGFLREILGRPAEERPFLLIPVGYPADDCVVPLAATLRKPLEEIMVVDRGP